MNLTIALLARVAAAKAERMRAAAVLARQFAPSFNAVALLTPGETCLSRIFRWLLDETETHGQGGYFRDRFVADVLGELPEAWTGARVRCEVATRDGSGRIDLLMESRDRTSCVVIENKPWAGWQANQLARYLEDQLAQRDKVRMHVLIGDNDVTGALQRHWAGGTIEPLPTSVGASGFDAVVAWLEVCAAGTRADSVRRFLYDLADYCRHYILSEPNMTEMNETSDLILAGGEETLRAAHTIASAMPLAMTRDVARRLSGSVELIGRNPTLRVTIDGVPLCFVLFGDVRPWAGVTDKAFAARLLGSVTWSAPERLWPRWTYLNKVSEEGRALVEAAEFGHPEVVAQLVPIVARTLIGSQMAS